MEGFCCLRELRNRNIAAASLRVVSDDFIHDLPDLNKAIHENGNLKFLPLALAMVRQPIAAMRLIEGSLTGLKVLQRITTKLFSTPKI